MYKDKSICVVVPAYNEATQIGRVIETMPDYVDRIVIIDDVSIDETVKIVKQYQLDNDRIVLIKHNTNQGCGGAIATGYMWARDNSFDVAVRMDGDGQMDPDDLEKIIEPVVNRSADYSKGNRLFYGDAWKMIPHSRYLGNSFLSLLTKVASGYWHIADSQSGYTAISLTALKRMDLNKIYKDYGIPNDLLIKLNQHDFRVKDVHIKPVYNIGEKSNINLIEIIPKLSWLLFKGFCTRLFFKYVIKDFHPLIFFYMLGGLFGIATVILFIRVFIFWIFIGHIPPINALAAMFSFMSTSQFILFAMWFDMQENKDLK